MFIAPLCDGLTFTPQEIMVMSAAFNDAIRLRGVTDRESSDALFIAERVIGFYICGICDISRLAKMAAADDDIFSFAMKRIRQSSPSACRRYPHLH